MKVEIKKQENKQLQQKIKKLIEDSKKELRVGFLENSKYPDGEYTTVQVAIMNEYGHKTKEGNIVPARPFMSQTVNKNKTKWMQIFEKKIKETDLNINKTLNILGLIATSDMKETIIKGEFKPLAQSTIDKKGTSKPLIETTHMINSIDYEVADNKKGGK